MTSATNSITPSGLRCFRPAMARLPVFDPWLTYTLRDKWAHSKSSGLIFREHRGVPLTGDRVTPAASVLSGHVALCEIYSALSIRQQWANRRRRRSGGVHPQALSVFCLPVVVVPPFEFGV